ncbi:MAG TPA: peptide chain release factor N(5)-glutamine methyltransferase [Dissulfurispiraceae bacterium]|nr:peptide chain release factor N(5)-glutamine methyltransferase [Dissulfurispiraceae bacterium]
MTAIDKLRELSQLFTKAGIPEPTKEAATLLTETLNISSAALHASPHEIDGNTATQIDALAARRVRGEPLQYLIGHVDFWGMSIQVGKGVLIPRPETELMVEETIRIMMDAGAARQLAFTEAGPRINILDLCTGSGCIALALAKEFPQAAVYGIDKSAAALAYARKNADCNRIGNVTFIEGDLFRPLNSGLLFDCIISNPPYIRSNDISGLQKEIGHEPAEALDGGESGLDYYNEILKEAPRHLDKKGIVILEIGFDQADDVRRIAAQHGFRDIRFIKDYAGFKRIFVAKLYS